MKYHIHIYRWPSTFWGKVTAVIIAALALPLIIMLLLVGLVVLFLIALVILASALFWLASRPRSRTKGGDLIEVVNYRVVKENEQSSPMYPRSDPALSSDGEKTTRTDVS